MFVSPFYTSVQIAKIIRFVSLDFNPGQICSRNLGVYIFLQMLVLLLIKEICAFYLEGVEDMHFNQVFNALLSSQGITLN